jgi:hypothetical protein
LAGHYFFIRFVYVRDAGRKWAITISPDRALEEIAMKTTVRKKKGGARSKTLKEEKRDIGRSLKAFGKRVTKALKK